MRIFSKRLWRGAFACLLLAAALAAQQITISIRKDNVKARRSPSRFAQVLAQLHRDETFIVLDDVPHWYQIRLRNRRRAWVPKSQATTLATDPAVGGGDTGPAPIGGETDVGELSLGNFITLPPPEAVSGCTPRTIPLDPKICPATGSGGVHAEAYKQKNRQQIVCSYRRITVQQILDLPLLPASVRSLPDTDTQLRFLQEAESTPVRLEGFFAMTKNGSREGVNCNIDKRFDLRMEVVAQDVPDPRATRPRHIVTEATPWFRAVFTGWTPSTLGDFSSYTGGFPPAGPQRRPSPIRVYGFLFFDEAHLSDGSIGTIRGTVWEVHPVTRIEVESGGMWRQIE